MGFAIRCAAFITLLAPLILSSGCATMARGSFDAVEFTSEPSGAKVSVERVDQGFVKKEMRANESLASVQAIVDQPGYDELETINQPITATTPVTLQLKRNGDYRVTMSTVDDQPLVTRVVGYTTSEGVTAMSGNIIAPGGVFGAGLDARNAAMKDLFPNPVHADFDRNEITVYIDGDEPDDDTSADSEASENDAG